MFADEIREPTDSPGATWRGDAAIRPSRPAQDAHRPSTTLPRLITISGPIACGKSTVARLLTDRLRATRVSVALVDLDTVAEMALPTLPSWEWVHDIHAHLVGLWLATGIEVVVDEGTSTVAELGQVLQRCPADIAMRHIVLTADFEASLARALAEPTRGLSKDRAFLRRQHDLFAQELPRLPRDLRLHVEGRTPPDLVDVIAAAVIPTDPPRRLVD